MTRRTDERPTLLHHYFHRAASRNPGHTAVEVPAGGSRRATTTVTYGELASIARSIASHLRSFLRADEIVAISLPRDSHWLYAAQLGALEAGAAFTCIDPAFPDAQLRAIIDDARPAAFLTDAHGAARARAAAPHLTNIVDVRSIGALDHTSAREQSGNSLAYIIYTSGTTGAPKGVMIEHRSIVNLVASDLDEFSLTAADRVAQGSSAAYDSSIEETWLALASGATLVVMDDETSRLGPDLVDWLRRHRITVFCPPPTLLRTTGCENPREALPDLRLLYVGGEALTQDLADRWALGRRLVNGYGPTECTVTVVRGDVPVGGPVTIGKPVPGHDAFVLDDALNPVARGAEGELCIRGIGLARGYRNKPELTGAKFFEHPSLGRIYRTGDLVRLNAHDDLEYLGRIDAQVKLRGYRIELEAIEAHIAACPGVREAACRVQGEGGAQLIAAHVVCTDASAPPDLGAARAALRASLPSYMVPARMAFIDVLPRSVGGKVNRRALPDLAPDGQDAPREVVGARNAAEELVMRAFGAALRTAAPIGVHDDFFADLGGDSLSAVGVVCELRKHPSTAGITTRDVFQRRTCEQLAEAASSTAPRRTSGRSPGAPSPQDRPYPRTVALLQTLWLLLALVASGAIAYAALFEGLPSLLGTVGIFGAAIAAPLLAFLIPLVYLFLSVALTIFVKWAFVGRYREVVTPVWSELYFRHWVVEQTARLIPWSWLAGTTSYAVVLRLLGARIGKRVHIHHGVELQRGGWDLLTLGDDVSLNCDSWLGLVELDGGCLHIAPVTIEDGATVGVRAGVSGGATMGKGAQLTALSWLPTGRRIPAGEKWNGVPAEPAGGVDAPPAPQDSRALSPTAYSALVLTLHAFRLGAEAVPGALIVALLALAFDIDGAQVTEWLANPTWDNGLLPIVLLGSVIWVPCSLAGRALASRAMGRVTPGVINRWSVDYLRVWQKSAILESAGRWLSGTLFWPYWLRLAGMRVGRRCEVSTIIDVVPECVSIGDESFFADGIYLGGPKIDRATATIGMTSLSRGTFLGNHVVVPAGVALPEGYFAGVCTVTDQAGAPPNSAWFGHPAMELPRREIVAADRAVTFEPGFARLCSRLFWESLRFTLPVLPLLIGAGVLSFAPLNAGDGSPLLTAFVAAPLTLLSALAASCAFVLVLKWALLGRSSAGQHPLWSCWCSRWDFLYVAWQFYALAPLSTLQGTPLLNLYLRSTGARIGRHAVLGPGFAQLVDPDMLFIEDGATVNANFQAHSFEDRVLKLAPVYIRRGASIGENTVVFYGADVGENAWVAPNGVVMKNESLPPNAEFAGCPLRPAAPEPRESMPALVEALPTKRLAPLDIARGLAVTGMIFLHFVPADETLGVSETALGTIAKFLEGKPAALFCVLAGFAWQMQYAAAAPGAASLAYIARRAAFLLAAGLALHAFAWPTEVLVPMGLMLLVCAPLARARRAVIASLAAAVLAATPIAHVLYSSYIESDWLADGSHLADHGRGWAWARALLFDGNYPLLPWLALPLLGMLLATVEWKNARTSTRTLVVGCAAAALAQTYAYWAAAHDASLAAGAPFARFEWVPTRLAFIVLAGASAAAVIALLIRSHHSGRLTWALRPFASFGRASLTHYIAHICLVYTPLTWVRGDDGWSGATGLLVFALYLAFAVPASSVWMRFFPRGPVESIWARASGSLARRVH